MSETAAADLAIEGSDQPVPKLSHIVARRIRDSILSGRLAQGANLPSESALLKLMRVSRPVLREALRILEGEGMIRTGRGTRHPVVLGPSIQKSAQFTSYLLAGDAVTLGDLHQARKLVEPEIVRSISGERRERTARELARCVGAFDPANDPGGEDVFDLVTLSKRFHEILMNASPNPVLRTICRTFHEIAMRTYDVLTEGNQKQLQALRNYAPIQHAAYRQLADDLAAGDTEHAAAGWTAYIVETERMMETSGLAERPLTAIG